MKKLIIFDMDGTLANTSLGIINSHRYAHKTMGRPIPNKSTLENVIGGPLLGTYISKFGFSEAEARIAVSHYRKYYAETGLLEAELYPEIKETLQSLKNKGHLLAVATLKAECFVNKMLDSMGISLYFDAIFGMDDQDTRTKAQLIQMCMEHLNIATSDDVVMVGDSIHDLNGAVQAGVSFIGVTYGFGFKPSDASIVDYTLCDSPLQLIENI